MGIVGRDAFRIGFGKKSVRQFLQFRYNLSHRFDSKGWGVMLGDAVGVRGRRKASRRVYTEPSCYSSQLTLHPNLSLDEVWVTFPYTLFRIAK